MLARAKRLAAAEGDQHWRLGGRRKRRLRLDEVDADDQTVDMFLDVMSADHGSGTAVETARRLCRSGASIEALSEMASFRQVGGRMVERDWAR